MLFRLKTTNLETLWSYLPQKIVTRSVRSFTIVITTFFLTFENIISLSHPLYRLAWRLKIYKYYGTFQEAIYH